MKTNFPSVLGLLAVLTWAVSESAFTATLYTNRPDFEAAVGIQLQTYDFEDFPTNSQGWGAFSNGQGFMNDSFFIESLTFDSDITLFPSGLQGTFQVHTSNPPLGKWVTPGGNADFPNPADDDDFRIDFSIPLAAFGLDILDSRPENGEALSILSQDGTVISSAPLPGTTAGSGSNGFVGFVLEPGDSFISAVEVQEGLNLDDDIGIDNVSFAPVPLPPALWLFGSGLLGLLSLS